MDILSPLESPSNPSRRSLSPRSVAAVLLLITGLAAANRLLGLDYLLPHSREPDTYAVKQVTYLRDPVSVSFGEDKKALRKYPWVTARATALLPDPRTDPRTLGANDLEGHLRAASAEVRQVRIVVALLSVLIVPGTFLLARAFLSAPWALCAAAFAATSLLHLNYSQQARPHAVAAGFAVLAVASAIWVRRSPKLLTIAVAAAFAGLAFGSLQFGVAALAPLAAALLLGRRGGRRLGWAGPLLALVVLALAVLTFYPFALEPGTSEGVSLAGDKVKIGSHSIDAELFSAGGFARMARWIWSYDPVLTVLGALGVLAVLVRRGAGVSGERADLLVAASHGLLFFLALGLYSKTPARFMLPLLPYAAVFAALGLRAVHGVVARGARFPTPRAVAGAVLLVVATGLPAFVAFRLAYVRSRPDTVEQAAQWVLENTRPADRIAMRPGLYLPLFERRNPGARPASSRYNSPWGPHLRALAAMRRSFTPARAVFAVYDREPGSSEFTIPTGTEATKQLLAKLDADYVVTTRGEEASWRRTPLADAARDLGTLVFEAKPTDGPAAGRGYQWFQGSVFALALTCRSWGPGVEIYEL